MYQFMTLREFLASFEKNSLNSYMSASMFLVYYDTAKVSFEKYGPEGPPYGTVVETLRVGFCGGIGVIRTLVEFTEQPRRYIGLQYMDQLSISKRSHWWCDFKVANDLY